MSVSSLHRESTDSDTASCSTQGEKWVHYLLKYSSSLCFFTPAINNAQSERGGGGGGGGGKPRRIEAGPKAAPHF